MLTQYIYQQNKHSFLSSFWFRHLLEMHKKNPQDLILIVSNKAEKDLLYQTLIEQNPTLTALAPIYTEQQFFSEFFLRPSPDQLFFAFFLYRHYLLTQQHNENIAQLLKSDILLKQSFELVLQLIQTNIPWSRLSKVAPNFRLKYYKELSDCAKEFKKSLLKNHCYSVLKKNNYPLKTPLTTPNNTIIYFLLHYPVNSEKYQALQQFSSNSKELILLGSEQNNLMLTQSFPDAIDIPEKELPEKTPPTLFEFNSIQNEIKWIFEQCLNPENEHKSPPCILLPNHNDYKNQLLNAAKNYQIDLEFISSCFKTKSRLFSTLLAILDFSTSSGSLNDYSNLSMNASIQQFYTPQASSIDFFHIERLASKFSLHKSQENCQEVLKKIQEHLSQKLAIQVDQQKKDELSKDLELTLQHLATLESLSNFQQNIKSAHTGQLWFDSFYDLLKVLGIIATIETSDQKEIDQFNDIISQIKHFLTLYKQFPQASIQSPLFIKDLKDYLNQHYRHIKNPQKDIQVYSLEDAYYITEKQLFFCGCAEDLHTLTHPSNMFITSEISSALNLNQQQKQLTNNAQQILQNNHCTLTYCKHINNEERLPSSLLSFSEIKPIHLQTNPEFFSPPPYPVETQLQKSLWPNIQKKLETNKVSPTLLDMYQQCPYKFFLYYLLDFKEADNDNHFISHSDWGIVVHDILAQFNRDLSENKVSKSLYFERLKAIALGTLTHIKDNSSAWQVKETLLLSDTGLLALIAKHYEENDYLKQSIGIEYSISKQLTPDITLKGNIDLLLKTNFGPIIVDYKSGKTLATASDTEHLRKLQIPLYLLLSQALLKETPAAAILFQVHSNEHCEQKIIACTKESKSDLFDLKRKRPFIYDASFLNRIAIHAQTLLSNILNGNTSAQDYDFLSHVSKQRSSTCSDCSYKLQCRYKDRFNT